MIGVFLALSTVGYSQKSDSLKIEIVKAVLSDSTEFNRLPYVIADIMGISITQQVDLCEDVILGNEWTNIGQQDVGDVQYLTLYRPVTRIGVKNAVNANVVVLGLMDGVEEGEYIYKFCAIRNE